MTQRIVNYTYGTGNPVLPDGSIDVRDGIDNLQSLDIFMNADEDTYNQRDGDVVSTVSGANRRFDAQILNMGFTRIGTFAAGATLTNPRQTLLWDIADGGDGQEYGWSGAFQKVVPAASTPASTGGISVGAWISRFDPELRIQVREALRRSYAEAGYNVVGTFQAGFTFANANDVGIDETTGKGFTGPAGAVAAGTDPASGGFVDCSRKYGPRRFASASDMINAADIGISDLCEISSYSGSSGFGGGTWVAASSTSVAANGVTKLASANASVTLVLQHSGEVNLCQVGAVAGADVTNIINVLNGDPSIHTVYGSRLAFVCSNTVFLKKAFIGRGGAFDFAGAPADSDSVSAYNFPEYSEISDFKIVNSKRVALIGNGTGTQIERVRAFNSVKQGINWAGDDWEVSRCLVNGVTQEFGVVNGGNSKRFKITKCNVFNVTGAGSFELGYQFSDCEVDGCLASDGFAGLQVFPGTTLAGEHTTMRNIKIRGFTSRNMSNAHVHIKNDFSGSGITLNDVALEDLAIEGGGAGTGLRATNIVSLRLDGGAIKNVGGYAMEILSGVGETEINDVDFDGVTGSIPFIFTASDNVTVNNSYFKNGNAIIGANSGNAFEKILLSGCRTKNISTPHINISELSIKYWNGNDFVTTFYTAAQLLGSYPAGYKRYYTNPQPGGSIGQVCTVGGVVGSTAVFKSFGQITA